MRWSPLWKLLIFAMLMGAALMQAAAAEYRIIDSSTDERCAAHECQRIISSYARFTEDRRNASDALGISYANGLLNYSCTDYWAAFEVRVHTTQGDYPLRTVLNAYPSIRDSIVKEQQGYGWKYGLSLESLPKAAQDALTAIELRLAGSGGITYAEISREGYDLIGRGCRLSFMDLVESGFSVEMNRTSIIIGNVSGKAELLLDPIVTLENDTSVIDQDTYVLSTQPDDTFGSASLLRASNIRRTAIFLNYTTLNLTNASRAELNLYRVDEDLGDFNVTAQLYRCNQSSFKASALTWNNLPTTLTDCEEKNISQTFGNQGDWFRFNITSTMNDQLDGEVSFTLNYSNSTANTSNCAAAPWCRVGWASQNNANGSIRPYLNITYYRNIGPNATVTLLPVSPIETNILTCNYTYVDAEGDAENGTTFLWFVNQVPLYSQNTSTLSPTAFSWGDIVYCDVKPRDGLTFGQAVSSIETRINPAGSTGGGGGGTLVVVSPESQIGIDFGRAQYSFSVLTAPSYASKVFPVTNRGQRNLQGSVRMLGNLSTFMTAEICSLEATGCSENQVSIAAGETVLLRLSGTFPRGWGPQTEGIVRLRDGFTGEASDLVVTADRPPLAFFNVAGAELGYVGFSERFDLSERAALFAYLALLGLALLAAGGAAA